MNCLYYGDNLVREKVISFRTSGPTNADKDDLKGCFERLRDKRKRERQKERDK